MSTDKQERLLRRCPEIIIATPGRFWELFSERASYLESMAETLRFLVLDEADRMVEQGHFRDLDSILDVLRKKEYNHIMILLCILVC